MEYLEVENAYTHIWMVYLQIHNFRFPHCHLVAEVVFRAEMAFQAEVPLVLVEVRQFFCASSVSVDSLLYHIRMERSQPYELNKPLPGVFPSQPSPSYAQETKLLASSLLRLRWDVSRFVVAFPLLCRTKSLLSPVWPHSWQGSCRTVPAVPDLLAST
jgi:hypothetical protein